MRHGSASPQRIDVNQRIHYSPVDGNQDTLNQQCVISVSVTGAGERITPAVRSNSAS
jgi:hypothetical protein